MRGRRKSVEEHVLDGTYRADRHGPQTDVTVSAPPPPRPDTLTGEAAAVWDEVTPLLAGIVTKRDVVALVDLCRWIARARRIADALDAVTPGDKVFRGLLVAAGIATDKIVLWSGRFGLSPADRAKLRVETSGPAKAKVRTRPVTAFDTSGAPNA